MKSISNHITTAFLLILATKAVAFNSAPTRVAPSVKTINPTIVSAWHQEPIYKSKRSVCLYESNSDGKESKEEKDGEIEAVTPQEGETLSRTARLRKKLFPPKEDDGLTFRQRLAKAGLSVVLSYGWVSNVSYSITVSLAWFIFSKQTGLSPLAPQQWKKFLGVYAGFYVFNNFVRPLRLGISVGVSVYFERVIKAIQERLGVKKGVAIFITVFLANVVGTISLMCLGIWLAAMAAGVPIFVK
ncbi:MAG: hypothetical protein SGBAC_006031 [Bacillariaceae sp.]